MKKLTKLNELTKLSKHKDKFLKLNSKVTQLTMLLGTAQIDNIEYTEKTTKLREKIQKRVQKIKDLNIKPKDIVEVFGDECIELLERFKIIEHFVKYRNPMYQYKTNNILNKDIENIQKTIENEKLEYNKKLLREQIKDIEKELQDRKRINK